MIEKDGVNIQDNFLAKEEFIALRDIIMTDEHFPWFFKTIIVNDKEKKSTSPGQFVHTLYDKNVPQSSFYESHIFPILKRLNVVVLFRIKANLRPRREKPFYSRYHTDIEYLDKDVTAHSTTSILYINTNNGYTEFKDGTIIESVANRLVSFPLTTKHRGVTQTDEQTRIVINFNYFSKPYIL